MQARIRRERKPLEAVHGLCRWLLQPAGERPGMLTIGELTYLFQVLRHGGRPYGFRLSRETDADGPAAEYQLPTDLAGCDCPDAVYRAARPGGCKHRAALRVALLALGTERAHGELTY